MSNLERRYRRLLKVLPGWYRRDREEEMVSIFLAERTDELDLEHSWPLFRLSISDEAQPRALVPQAP